MLTGFLMLHTRRRQLSKTWMNIIPNNHALPSLRTALAGCQLPDCTIGRRVASSDHWLLCAFAEWTPGSLQYLQWRVLPALRFWFAHRFGFCCCSRNIRMLPGVASGGLNLKASLCDLSPCWILLRVCHWVSVFLPCRFAFCFHQLQQSDTGHPYK